LEQDHENPPGVKQFTDLPDFPTQVPVSTKIGETLRKKLGQCEGGIINIVALGNPRAMHDDDVIASALYAAGRARACHVSVAGSEAASDLLAVYFQAGIVDAVFIGKTGCGSAW
jgi:hypothetical protein